MPNGSDAILFWLPFRIWWASSCLNQAFSGLRPLVQGNSHSPRTPRTSRNEDSESHRNIQGKIFTHKHCDSNHSAIVRWCLIKLVQKETCGQQPSANASVELQQRPVHRFAFFNGEIIKFLWIFCRWCYYNIERSIENAERLFASGASRSLLDQTFQAKTSTRMSLTRSSSLEPPTLWGCNHNYQ